MQKGLTIIMTVKLNLSAKTYKADFGERYGVFAIRPMGAGEELELSQMADEMNNSAKALAEIDESKKPEEYTAEDRATIDGAVATVQKSKVRTIEILMGLFESETEGAVDKLFKELDVATIRSAYDEVIANA